MLRSRNENSMIELYSGMPKQSENQNCVKWVANFDELYHVIPRSFGVKGPRGRDGSLYRINGAP